MKHLTIIISIIISLLIIPSVSAQEKKKRNILKELFGISVIETNDKFEGTTTFQMNGNKVFTELSGNNGLGNAVFGISTPTYDTFLNLEKHILKDSTYELSILLKVEAKNEVTVDIMEGESLIFLLDNNRINLNTEGALNTDFDTSNSTSVVNARYVITSEQLEIINSSDNIEFRMILDSFQSGTAKERDKKNQYLDGEFKKKNKKAWAEFYENYISTNE